MRWWLMGALLTVAAGDGLLAAEWPVFGVKLPITWLVLYLTVANEWVGWRQGLLLAACAGYILDVLAAPVPGAVLVSLLAAWAFGTYILSKYKFSRDSKIAGLIGGSVIFMSSSFAAGPYFPHWLNLLSMAAVYLLVSLASYAVINATVKSWLARV